MTDAAAAMDLGGGLGGLGGDSGGGGGDLGSGGDPFSGGDPMGLGGTSLSDLAGGALAAPGMSASSYGGNIAATAMAQNDPTGGQGAQQAIAAAQPQPGAPGGGVGGTQSGPPPINAGTLPPPGYGTGGATPASPGTPVRTTTVPQQSFPTMPIPGNNALTPQGGFSSGAEEPSFTPQSSLTTSPPSPGYSSMSDRFGQWMTTEGPGGGVTAPVTAQAPQAQPSIIQAAPGPGNVQTAPDQPAPAAPIEEDSGLNVPDQLPSSKGDRLTPTPPTTPPAPLVGRTGSSLADLIRQAWGGGAGPTGNIGNLPTVPSTAAQPPPEETEYTQPPAKTDTPAKTAPATRTAPAAPATRTAPAAPAAPAAPGAGGHWEFSGPPSAYGGGAPYWVPDTTPAAPSTAAPSTAAPSTAAPSTAAPSTSSAQPGAGTPQQQAQQQLDNFFKHLPMSSLLGLARALFGPRWPGWQGLPHWAPPPAGRAPFAPPPNTTGGAPRSSAPAPRSSAAAAPSPTAATASPPRSRHAVGTEVAYSRTTTPTLKPAEDPRGLESYIRQSAQRNGVNPNTAVKVAMREGLSRFDSGIRGENSWGAFQLNTQRGRMGAQFQQETGLDPSDPKNEKATIDYAMKRAARNGWGEWMGASKAGIRGRMGIGPAPGAQRFTDPMSGGDMPEVERPEDVAPNTLRDLNAQIGQRADWQKFMREARPSTNVEDLSDSGTEARDFNTRFEMGQQPPYTPFEWMESEQLPQDMQLWQYMNQLAAARRGQMWRSRNPPAVAR
jgi:hypothetical protein